MARGALLSLCVLAGCSSHPWGDTLDTMKPGRLYPDNKITPYGGICRNQGPVFGPGAGGAPQINVGPPQPFAPPGPVIPPAVPFPGGAPAGPAPFPPPPPPPGN